MEMAMRTSTTSLLAVSCMLICSCGVSPVQQAHIELIQKKPSRLLKKHPNASAFIAQYGFNEQNYLAADAATKQELSSLDSDIQSEYVSVVSQCSIVLSNEATQNYASRNAALAIEIVGALAGSIAVPALAAGHAAAALIAGVGGVSGTANVLQNSIRSVGYDPESLYATREKLRQSVIADVTAFQTAAEQNPPNATQELAILDHLTATCAFVPISEPVAVPPDAASAPTGGTQ